MATVGAAIVLRSFWGQVLGLGGGVWVHALPPGEHSACAHFQGQQSGWKETGQIMDHCPKPPPDLSQMPLHFFGTELGGCWLLLAGKDPREVALVCLSLHFLYSFMSLMLSNYPSPSVSQALG